jgi:hypothetical protein
MNIINIYSFLSAFSSAFYVYFWFLRDSNARFLKDKYLNKYITFFIIDLFVVPYYVYYYTKSFFTAILNCKHNVIVYLLLFVTINGMIINYIFKNQIIISVLLKNKSDLIFEKHKQHLLLTDEEFLSKKDDYTNLDLFKSILSSRLKSTFFVLFLITNSLLLFINLNSSLICDETTFPKSFKKSIILLACIFYMRYMNTSKYVKI